jgi:glycolate oxidase subunit GlcD
MATSIPAHLFPKHQLITDPAELITFEVDAGFDRGKPDAVVYPESTADVSRLLQWVRGKGVPIVARGAGTGLSGGAVAARGGIIVEFARLNRILELDIAGRAAVVEPGVVNLALDAAAKAVGLYFPPDPSSGRSAVIGGNVAENSGGPHCFKYGVTTNYIIGLEAVLAGGQVIRTGGRALDYPEYDLCGLLAGSEGTLALITRCEARLIRNPPAVKTLMVSFASDEAAGQAVSAIIAAGLVPATLEMMDRRVMGMIEAYVPVGLPVDAAAALIVEVDGYAASLESQVEEIADILLAHGGYDLRIAQTEDERQRIWYGRKSAAGAFARLSPAFYLVDVTVPRSHLAATLADIGRVLERYRLETGHVFHAGDGNLHPCILCDPKDAAMMQRVLQACEEIVAICVARDGSITGEHGVGIEKRAYMPMMYSDAELAAMADVKHAFDPQGLLNPGKVLPDELPAVERVPPKMPASDPFAPASPEEAAGGLAAFSAAGRLVRIAGYPSPALPSLGKAPNAGHPSPALPSLGREPHAGSTRPSPLAPRPSPLILPTNLRGIHKFAPDDLYVTVGAGTPLVELQAFLAEHRMQVPLASPWPEATVGGLAAANVNAPLRMRYGGWRDNLLCTTVALPDGRVVRAGRPVVKNVAGYDLAKLFVGSQGTLGLMCDLTLKLAPLPRAARTLCVPVEEQAAGLAWAQATAHVWLATTGVVLAPALPGAESAAAPWQLLITVEGLAEDVDAEVAELAAALRKAGAAAPSDGTVTATGAWAALLGAAGDDGCLVRAGVPARALQAYWAMIPVLERNAATWCVDVSNGLAYALHPGAADDTLTPWLAAVREPALALGGYAAVMAAHVASQIDRTGYRPEGEEVVRRLKARWDPAGVLGD